MVNTNYFLYKNCALILRIAISKRQTINTIKIAYADVMYIFNNDYKYTFLKNVNGLYWFKYYVRLIKAYLIKLYVFY